jgi:uncharacterized paraquat-inducible protein A
VRRLLNFLTRAAGAVGTHVILIGYCVLMFYVTEYCVKRFGWDPRLSMPLLATVLLFSALAAVTLRSALKRAPTPPGHCSKCGYDLTGNESGRCPECGSDYDILAVCEKCERSVRFRGRLQGTVQTCPYCGDRSEVPFVAGLTAVAPLMKDQPSQHS